MDNLKNTLNKIHFSTDTGLVFCNNLNQAKHISERYHIEEKALKLGVTAVLFRRKYNQDDEITDSKAVLYIYKEENSFFNSQAHKDLHAKLWSAGDIEVYFIISSSRIDIINARKPAEVKDNDKLDVEQLRLISETLQQFNDQRFSALAFNKGTFWEQEDFFDPQQQTFYHNQLKEENTPFHQLLEYLLAVRKHLHNKQNKPSAKTINKTIDKLLIICILVKFLEDIKDDDGKHTLRSIYQHYAINNFAEALEQGICLSILKQLGREFNGNIFYNFSSEEEQQIQNTDLTPIAQFLRATLDPITNQYFLWEQYSFQHLPVELISAIYEQFLPQEKDVVYTPPFLVNFLIDEVMPLDKADMYFSQNQFKVFDPSCGSGVFLVAAYKRMLQWWSINNYYASGEKTFCPPEKEICQEILQNNIFGVDIEPTATLISVFSLTIALLDRLEPKEIWHNLKLNSLQENIKTKNFFEWAIENKNKKFDLVIGNPPFNPKSGMTPKKAVTDEQMELFSLSNNNIPYNNFALKFFEGAMFFGRRTCMILQSSVLLYNKAETTQKYRTRIFTEFTIEKIFDFTHLRRILFGSVDTPVCVLLAKPEESQGQNIEHIVVKRLTSSEKNIFFEIDYYDIHLVPHNRTIDPKKQFVWKTNLLGGGRLFHLIYRLSLLPTLKDFINSQDNWKVIRGFEGGKKLVKKNQDQIIGIRENGDPKIKRNVDIYSNNFKSSFMYKPPFIVTEQVLGKNFLPSCFIPVNNNFSQKMFLYYNRNFIGISVPKEDEDTLKNIYEVIRQIRKTNNLVNSRFFAVSISSNCLILHETAIRQEDILSLPYFPENEDYLELSQTEKFLQEDVLEYYIHLGKAISERGEGRKLEEKVTHTQLENFGQVFCDTLNPIYAKDGKSWQCGKFYQTQYFTISQLGYGKDNGLSFEVLDDLDDIIKPLIYNNTSNRGAIFTRVCRIYKHVNGYDSVFLIKPSATRYWLNSKALRDADKTFADLWEAGL